MRKVVLLILVSFLFCIPVTLQALERGSVQRVPRLFGTFTPKVGSWSQYAIVDKATGRQAVMKMSIVGKEGDSYWYEVVNKEGDSRNVVKMLVKGDPNDRENIQRLIMKSGDNPPMEMARDFVMMGRKMAALMFEQRSGVPSTPGLELKPEKIGEEKVSVMAGIFDVTRYRIVDQSGKVYGLYSFSEKVMPFGLVTSDAEKTTMELLGYGMDAQSVITEEPQMMTMPPGMPQGMPRGFPPGMLENMPKGMKPGPPSGVGPPAGMPGPPK